MKGKKLLLLLVVAVIIGGLVLVVAGCGTEETTTTKATTATTLQNYNLKLGHVVKVGHPGDTSIAKFVADVAAASSNRIKITVYPGGTLGADAAELKAIIAGTQDMGGISLSTFSNYLPVLDAYQLPFLVNNYDVEQSIMQDPLTRQMLDKLETIGVKGLAVYEYGIRGFLSKKGQIKTPADLAGVKVRVVPATLLTTIFKDLECNVVSLVYGQVYTGLQTGVVDGTEMNPSSLWTEKFYEVAKKYTDMRFFPFPFVIVMNLKKWNSLSTADQDLMLKAAEGDIPYNIQVNKDMETTYLPKMVAAGLKTYPTPDLTPFEALVAPIYTTWEAKDPLIKQFVDKVNQLKASTTPTSGAATTITPTS